MGIILSLTIIIITIGVSVILHELAHGYVAKYLGDDTAEKEGRLSFNPIVHIHPIFTLALPVALALLGQPVFGAAKPVPVQAHKLKGEEFGMALVAVVGPLMNLFLAILGSVIIRLFTLPAIAQDALFLFVGVNVGFFVFNMIPIPPLDGSRVLYAFSPEFLQNILTQLERFGLLIIFFIVLVGMPIIGLFIGAVYSYITTLLLG